MPGIFSGGLTTLSSSCVECHEILEPQRPGSLRASPGLYRNPLNFFICIRISHVFDHFSGFVLIKALLNNDAADILRFLLKVRIYVVPHILDCIFHRQTVFCLHYPILIYDTCHIVYSAFIFKFRTYQTHSTKENPKYEYYTPTNALIIYHILV